MRIVYSGPKRSPIDQYERDQATWSHQNAFYSHYCLVRAPPADQHSQDIGLRCCARMGHEGDHLLVYGGWCGEPSKIGLRWKRCAGERRLA